MIILWNVRGFNQGVKQIELRILLKRNKVTLIAIYEHRLREEKSSSIINRIMPSWSGVQIL